MSIPEKIRNLRSRKTDLRLGGGPDRVEAQHKKQINSAGKN